MAFPLERSVAMALVDTRERTVSIAICRRTIQRVIGRAVQSKKAGFLGHITMDVAKERRGASCCSEWRRLLPVAVGGVYLVTASCGSAPTQPSSRDVLAIRPTVDAIVVGTQQAFTAWLESSGGDKQVDASWSSDDVNVAQVSQSGVLRGVTFGSTTLRATHSSLSAARPLAVVNSYGGTWTGTAKISACDRVSGVGPNTCAQEIGLVVPVQLILQQDGASVSGTATLHRIGVSGAISGASRPSGSLTLSGTLRNSEDRVEMEILSWDTRLQGDTKMIGGFTIKNTFQNIFGVQVHQEIYELQSLGR